jgi:hypothetical protein
MVDQRWYMFQNMGPAPTPRSGHAMVAAHGKVFVVGGEANASSAAGRDDPSLIHILDSCKSLSPLHDVLERVSTASRQALTSSQNQVPTRQSSPPIHQIQTFRRTYRKILR